jgi:hypothetical protein
MSIKNPSRLSILVVVIIGSTVLSLGALNYIIDKISKIAPPEIAHQDRPPPNLQAPPSHMPGVEASQEKLPSNREPPPRPTMAPGGAPQGSPVRRVQNGRNNADLEQRMPQAAPQGGQREAMPSQPYYPNPAQMSPQERENFEREMMMRQQQMMQEQEYMPEYPNYDPQGPYYPDYNDPNYYEDDWEDYDPDYQGKRKDTKSEKVKVSEASHKEVLQDVENDEAHDDYFFDSGDEE